MIENNIDNSNPVLTFEGKKYSVNDLSSDTKEIIKGLKIAVTQLIIHKDTLKLLSLIHI